MLDLLYTLRTADGTGSDNNNTRKCVWQDLPGRIKLDNEGKEVALTACYKQVLRRLQHGASQVIETLNDVTNAVNEAGHVDAARDARVAGGWLRRLAGRDFTSTTWDSDYSRLDGFWASLRDAQVELETALRRMGCDLSLLTILVCYLNDLVQLQSEIDKIERSRTTLAQRVFWRVSATVTALRMRSVEGNEDDFWNERSVGSTSE